MEDLKEGQGGEANEPLPLNAEGVEQACRKANTWVIGLTGPFGSGCSTAAHLLSKSKQAPHTVVRLSDVLRRLAGNPAAGRKELQDRGNELRQTEGNEALVVRGLGELFEDGSQPPQRVVIDGIRNLGEVRWLQRALGDRFALFAITADTDERYKRSQEQIPSVADFYELDLRDQGESAESGQQVSLCVDYADVLIPNGHLGLHQIDPIFGAKVRQFAELIEGNTERYASTEEFFMNLAARAAHGSRCLKRQVGAVIAVNNELVSSGFNENSNGMSPCIDQFGTCYRDMVRHDRFKQLAAAGSVCPHCGEAIRSGLLPPWECSACAKSLDAVFFPDRAMQWCTALHAEERAIINASGRDLAEATLYTTTYPCMLCAEKIIHAGIRKVVYIEAYPDVHGEILFREAKVKTKRFEGVRSRNFERYFAPIRPAMEIAGEEKLRSMQQLPGS